MCMFREVKEDKGFFFKENEEDYIILLRQLALATVKINNKSDSSPRLGGQLLGRCPCRGIFNEKL